MCQCTQGAGGGIAKQRRGGKTEASTSKGDKHEQRERQEHRGAGGKGAQPPTAARHTPTKREHASNPTRKTGDRSEGLKAERGEAGEGGKPKKAAQPEGHAAREARPSPTRAWPGEPNGLTGH